MKDKSQAYMLDGREIKTFLVQPNFLLSEIKLVLGTWEQVENLARGGCTKEMGGHLVIISEFGDSLVGAKMYQCIIYHGRLKKYR